MAHVRTQLRAAVVLALKNTLAVPTLNGRVFDSRVYPLQDAELPAARVFTPAEEAEARVDDTRVRQVQLAIEVICKAQEGLVGAALDEICEQVETVLASRITVSTRPVALNYVSCAIDFDESERALGRATLTYTAELYTTASLPGTLIN